MINPKLGNPKTCDECLYKLGVIKMLKNPCPTCPVMLKMVKRKEKVKKKTGKDDK